MKDYEKKYKEALERAKKYKLKEDLIITQDIFPELAESENERIRKALIEMVHDTTGDSLWVDYNVHKEDALSWLEKQGKQKPTIEMKSAEESLGISSEEYNKIVDECIYGEQKPADKVKPKFKVSDWIINRTDATIMQIVNNKDFYESVEIGGQRRTDTYNYIEWDFRLWTIQDAKDGDVLACPNDAGDRDVVFIFKNINSDVGWVFCFCASDANGCFCTNNDYVGNSNSTNISPATKEQRDLLFRKMHEAGYEWDAEKKELKKIEDEFSWSKEDEEMWLSALEYIQTYPSHRNSVVAWLESLKERYTWRPSEEQMKAINHAIQVFAQSPYMNENDYLFNMFKGLKKDLEQLKAL